MLGDGSANVRQLHAQQLHQTLDLFACNSGLPNWETPKSRERVKRLKIAQEYRHAAQIAKRRGPGPATRTVAALRDSAKPLALPGVHPTAQVEPGETALATTDSSLLSHIQFKKAPERLESKWHAPWILQRVISGHTGWVRTVDVDPSNQWMVTGGNDRLLKFWDLASSELKLTLTGHISAIRCARVSKRHPYVFSGGEDSQVKCWDLEQNRVVRHYHGHLSGVYTLALHPSMDIFCTGGRDAAVRVWDMRTRKAVHVLEGHRHTVFSIAIQNNEPQIVSGSADNMVRCWDLVAGKSLMTMTHHKKTVRSLMMHPREYTFASCSADNIKVWLCPRPSFDRNMAKCKSIVNCSAYRDEPADNTGVFVAGGDAGHLHFYDWRTGQLFQTIKSTPQPGSLEAESGIFDMAFDLSESRLITAECDKTIKVWREDPDAVKPHEFD